METNMIVTGLEDVIEEVEEIQRELANISDRVGSLICKVGVANPRIEIKRASDKKAAGGKK